MLASVRRDWLVLQHETGPRLSTCLPMLSQSCQPSQALVASPTALSLHWLGNDAPARLQEEHAGCLRL